MFGVWFSYPDSVMVGLSILVVVVLVVRKTKAWKQAKAVAKVRLPT